MRRRAPPVPAVVRRLEQAYGKRPWKTWGAPLDELIVTVLSQNTNDRNSDAAMDRLKAAFPDWNDAADAPLARIADAVRPAGLHRRKAKHIRAILRTIRLSSGRIDLGFLRRWPTDRIRAYLRRLPGVGPKTAACVLLFALRRPVLPVDTHVHRTTRRLGLIGPKTGAEQAHEVLGKKVPPDLVYAFHVLLIEHGRRTCRARRPDCPACALARICPSARPMNVADRFRGRLTP